MSDRTANKGPKAAMRGGHRLVCSPYFVVALTIMLGLVTIRYWTLSTENAELWVKIEILQNQLKLSSSNSVIMDENLRHQQRKLDECKRKSDELQKMVTEERSKGEGLQAEITDEKQLKVKIRQFT